MINVSAPQRVRDAWMKAEGLEVVGKAFTEGEASIAKRLLLSKITDLDSQEAVQVTTMEVPAYVCMTKAKKQVTVTTTEAMKIIIENGGEFLSETTKEVKF